MASIKRRINSTGRKRIAHDRVSVQLLPRQPDGILRARAELSLEEGLFSGRAQVVLEAYQRMTTGMRFACGTIDIPDVPETLVLEDIDPSAPVLFRLKVVDQDEHPGRLLGTADRLRPNMDDSPDARASLFPIQRCELHSEIWKVHIDDRGPVLQLNYNVPGLTALIQKDPLVQGVLLPAALRVVLEAIAHDPVQDDDDSEGWKERWLRFCREQLNLGDDPPEGIDGDAKEAWVNDGVRAFCKAYGFVGAIRKSLGEGS